MEKQRGGNFRVSGSDILRKVAQKCAVAFSNESLRGLLRTCREQGSGVTSADLVPAISPFPSDEICERQNQTAEPLRCSPCVSFNTHNLVTPFAQVQREWLERVLNVPEPWQRRSSSPTLTFSPDSNSSSHSSPMVNSWCITLEPAVTVILNFFPSCTISEMLLMSFPFWISSSGSPAQEQETLNQPWSHQ